MLILAILGMGFAAGWVAQLMVGGQRDWTEAVIAGVAGSFVGGLLVSVLFSDGLAIRPSGLIGSIGGAVIVLVVWRAVGAHQS
jgi:uncharacterized membrane protein YeaQ/YmgE (transglycosylase-associated protein family)